MPAVSPSRFGGVLFPTGRRNSSIAMDGIYVSFPFNEPMRGALRQEFPTAWFDSQMKRWTLAPADYDHLATFFADRRYLVLDGHSDVIAQPVSARATS
jgi:hypothetical protein